MYLHTLEPYWNSRGVCINHWYHIKTTVDPNKDKTYLHHEPVNQEFGNTPSQGRFTKPWGLRGWTTDSGHNDVANFKTKDGGDMYHLEQFKSLKKKRL